MVAVSANVLQKWSRCGRKNISVLARPFGYVYSCLENTTHKDKPAANTLHYTCCFFLFPTWAWYPALIADTDCLDPHDSHVINEILVSFVRIVSGDLQVLQVTYSTISLIMSAISGIEKRYKKWRKGKSTHRYTSSKYSQSASAETCP